LYRQGGNKAGRQQTSQTTISDCFFEDIDSGSSNCSFRQIVCGLGNGACGRIAAPEQILATGSPMISKPPE
jgi:hypothetical protein